MVDRGGLWAKAPSVGWKSMSFHGQNVFAGSANSGFSVWVLHRVLCRRINHPCLIIRLSRAGRGGGMGCLPGPNIFYIYHAKCPVPWQREKRKTLGKSFEHSWSKRERKHLDDFVCLWWPPSPCNTHVKAIWCYQKLDPLAPPTSPHCNH